MAGYDRFLILKITSDHESVDNKAQHLTAFLFYLSLSALFNGFNVGDGRFGTLKD